MQEQKKKSPDKDDAEILKMLRAGIVLHKIEMQENITVTEEEVDHTVEHMAMQYHIPVASMKAMLQNRGGLEQIQADLAEAKTLDFLYGQAQVVEED